MRNLTFFKSIFGLLILAFFAVVFTTMAVKGLHRDEQFDQSKNRSMATVEKAWETYGRKGSTHFHVRYHFSDDRRRVWAVSNDTSEGTYNSVHMGTLVPVKYLEFDPSQSRIDLPNETNYHWHEDKLLGAIALGLGVFWCLLLWSTVRSVRRSTRDG